MKLFYISSCSGLLHILECKVCEKERGGGRKREREKERKRFDELFLRQQLIELFKTILINFYSPV